MKRTAISIVILSLTGCSTCCPEVESVAVDGLPNARRLGDLTFGGQPSEGALRALADQGFRTILTTRGPGEVTWDEKAAVQALGMDWVEVPMAKPVAEITDEQVEALAKALDSAPRPMLLHCGSGNRVSGLWAVWLVEKGGKTPEEALELAASVGMGSVRAVVERRLAPAASTP